jgi:asparagine synthase (glutamine-hydrolysing)
MSSYLLASQGDRALMANGIEGRFPYLDPHVIRFAAGLASSRKLRGLADKVVLRQLARKYLPTEISARPKWPYRAPIRNAFAGPAAPEYTREMLSPSALAGNPLLDGNACKALAARASSDQPMSEREEMALIGVLSTQLWYHSFIIGNRIDMAGETPPLRVSVDRRSASKQTARRSSH